MEIIRTNSTFFQIFLVCDNFCFTDAWPENIKKNKVGQLIEKQSCHFSNLEEYDSKADYHALTRGLVINEIVRRIDPQVRRISEHAYLTLSYVGVFRTIF